MRLNPAGQGTLPSDTDLKRVTATFRRREIETRFQQHTLAQTQRQLRISLLFGAFFELIFWLSDLAALGYNSTTQLLLAARLSVALVVVAGFYLLAKYPQSVRVPRFAATVVEMAAMCCFMLVIWNRPGEMGLHGMSMSIMLLVLYLFIPNTFVNATVVSLAASAAFIMLAITSSGATHADVTTMALVLVFTNAFGILALHRQERLSRQEYLAREIERQALATQRKFFAMLSHEFRTPLAIIDTTAQRLGTALEPRLPELGSRVSKIRRAVARMLTLLDNCLIEDRLNATDLVLKVEPVELRDFIRLNFGEFGAQASSRIRLVLPDAPQWVHCDRHLVDIALSSLVNNALKYSPEDSVVTICLQPDAKLGKIAIRVEDQGAGVPDSERNKIFDKFFRGNGNQSVPGAGLGLHLARELIRHHKGNVKLAPQAEHQGAAFILTLPQPLHPPIATRR